MSDPRLIARPSEFAALCERLAKAPFIALDTEFVPEYTYAPELCLVQVGSAEELAAIDPYEIEDLSPLWKVLTRPGCEVVVHAGKEEWNFCLASVGVLPERIIDVQVAAGLIGLGYPLSLENLLQKLVPSAKLNKGETRTDWRQRPLTTRQVEYALDDVRYLIDVRNSIVSQLKKMGRVEWLGEEMRRIRENSTRTDPERWRRVAGAGGLGPRELAVLKELVEWRDLRARRIDKPTRWILRDDLLVELAKRQPKTLRDLQNLRGMGTVAQGAGAGDVVSAIQRALALSNSELPARAKRRDAAEDAMALKVMSAGLIHVAHTHDVAAGLLGSTDDLKDMVDALLADEPTEPPPRLLQGWRATVCGEYFERLLDGRIRLRIVKERGRLRLAFDEDVVE